MHKILSRAIGATRNYLISRPLLPGFITFGAAAAISKAAVAALGIQA